jgi:hypothetical protein
MSRLVFGSASRDLSHDAPLAISVKTGIDLDQ